LPYSGLKRNSSGYRLIAPRGSMVKKIDGRRRFDS
jgi:hypothetical protein